MVAPKVESIFNHRVTVGIALHCPECPPGLGSLLRVETAEDYSRFPNAKYSPAGPLGFIARCDYCGFRVEMTGNRIPTVKMIEAQLAEAEPSSVDRERRSAALLVRAAIVIHREHSRGGVYARHRDWRDCDHPYCQEIRTAVCVDGNPSQCDKSSTGGKCDVCGVAQ